MYLMWASVHRSGSFMWLGEETWLEEPDKRYLYFLDLIVANGWCRCTRRRAYWVDNPQHLPPDDNIYRVQIDDDTGYVNVACIGLERVDALVDGTYADTARLPDWMQEKLAVLTMMSSKPPTETVDGVGRRIDNNTYWVFC